MIEFETDFDRIREVLTRPQIFPLLFIDLNDPSELEIDKEAIYIKLDDGLIFYKPNGNAVEMSAALTHIPENLKKIWLEHQDFLKALDFNTVYAVIEKENRKSRAMVRYLGFDLYKSHEKINTYIKVIT